MAAFFTSYKAEYLNPSNIEWLLHGDAAQQYFGWIYFLNGDWTFPIGATDLYFAPIGSTIGFSDTAPIYHTFLKLLLDGTGFKGQVTGYMVLLIYAFQGVLGYRLALQFTSKQVIAVISCLLLCFSTPLTFRFGHMSLLAHFLVLWGLVLTLREFPILSVKESPPIKSGLILEWMALLILCAGTHVYFSAIVSPFFLLTRGLDAWKRKVWWPNIGIVLSGLFLQLLVFWVFGYFSEGRFSAGPSMYGADLLTFVNPMGYSDWIPEIPRHENAYEGFAYLGLGLISGYLILFILLWKLRSQFKLNDILLNPVVLCSLLLLCYSFSNAIYIGGFKVASIKTFYSIFGSLTGIFRASGRFIWPVYYLIVVALLPMLYWCLKRLGQDTHSRFKPSLVFGAGVVLIGLLQAFDLQSFYSSHIKKNAQSQRRVKIDLDDLRVSSQSIKALSIMPPDLPDYLCMTQYDRNPVDWITFGVIAAHNELKFNSGMRARSPGEKLVQLCTQAIPELTDGSTQFETLYVFDKIYRKSIIEQAPSLKCRDHGEFFSCEKVL